MYKLVNTFSKKIISTHRTAGAALKAEAKFQKRFERAHRNSRGSYMPTQVQDGAGVPIRFDGSGNQI